MRENLPHNGAFQGVPVLCQGEMSSRYKTRSRITGHFAPLKPHVTVDDEIKAALRKVANTYISNLIKFIPGSFLTRENTSGILYILRMTSENLY